MFLFIYHPSVYSMVAQLVKNPPAMRETLISIPGLGRSAGEGNGYPLQYSGLELHHLEGIPGGSDDKKSARNAGDPGSITGSEKSPGEGNGNPLQYSRLENPMDGGAW